MRGVATSCAENARARGGRQGQIGIAEAPVQRTDVGDNGPEFTSELVRLRFEALQVQTLFIEPDRPWKNGYVESFRRQASR